MLPAFIFREYDIRARYGVDLCDAHAHVLGQALGTLVLKTHTPHVVVGRDGRLSSPALGQALIKGLLSTGVKVTYVGVGPSPYLYYCEKQLKPGAAVMITASHNDKDYNGFKIIVEGKSFFGSDLQNLYHSIQAHTFTTGQGIFQEICLKDDYIKRLHSTLSSVSFQKDISVVWDPGNGAACDILSKLVPLLPGRHVIINSIMDGSFPHHDPDPTQPQNCQQLLGAMKTHGAHVGFALDGDGDRLVMIDETGYIFSGDEVLLLLAQDVLKTHPGATIIGDVKVSDHFWTTVPQWGGKALMGRTGHSFIKSYMHETKALLAGEMSGHFFFADHYYGYDDGLYAALRVLIILQGTILSQWRAQFPKLFTSPEYRLPCNHKFEIMKHVKAKLTETKTPFNDIDGVRVTTPHGWWLIRCSHTQEALSARFEAKTKEGFEILRQHMNDCLMTVTIPPLDIS